MNESSSPSCEERSDRLTIRRLMLLTAGVAVGMVFFAPKLSNDDPTGWDTWRAMANAVIIGLAMPAPLFCIRLGSGNRRLGAGGMFALTAGLGVLLMLPPAVAEWLARMGSESNHNVTAGCLYYVLPLMGLWYLWRRSPRAMPAAACSVRLRPGPSDTVFFSRSYGRR